jgi:hypothetical protein
MKTDFITLPTLKDRISTNSNKIGLVLFYGLAMTNEQDINYAALREINTEQFQPTRSSSSSESFIEPQNEALSLFADKQLSEEQVILDFANRLLNNAEDIDPEISKVVQKRFWDMI